MTRVLIAAGLLIALAGAAIASADPRNVVVLGTKSATGRKAHALVVAPNIPTDTFRRLTMEVTAKPRQRVQAGWIGICFGGIMGRPAYETRGRTPLSIEIELSDVEHRCNVTADATLAGKGRVTIQVVGRR